MSIQKKKKNCMINNIDHTYFNVPDGHFDPIQIENNLNNSN